MPTAFGGEIRLGDVSEFEHGKPVLAVFGGYKMQSTNPVGAERDEKQY